VAAAAAAAAAATEPSGTDTNPIPKV